MKVAIIGAGRQGRRHALSIRQTGLGEVSLIVDSDLDLARILAKEYGANSVSDVGDIIGSNEIESVVIATPVAMHHQIVIDCLKSGKHVFCEKPLALTSAQADEMSNVANKSSRILQCAFIMRHHPGMRQAKRWIDSGKLGTISYANCEYARAKNFAHTWRANKALSGGGNLHDQAIHVLDLFQWFMGDILEGTSYRSTVAWDMTPLEDDVAGLLRTRLNAVASFHVSYARWRPLFTFEIGGSEALIRIEGMGNSDYGTQKVQLISRDDKTGLGVISESLEFFDADRPWNDEWTEFYNAIRQNRQPIGNGEDGAKALRLVEMLYSSSTYAVLTRGASNGQ